RRLAWPPSGPLNPGDRPRRWPYGRTLPPQALVPCRFPSPGWLTPPRVEATAARESATPHGGATPDLSAQRPSLACTAAPPWPSPAHWWAEARGVLDADWHGAAQRGDTPGRAPVADLAPLGAYTGSRCASRSPPPAGAG